MRAKVGFFVPKGEAYSCKSFTIKKALRASSRRYLSLFRSLSVRKQVCYTQKKSREI